MRLHRNECRPGFTLVELLFVIVIVGTALLVILPGLMNSSRGPSTERNAATSLKTLTSAEADFRANDRDWNHVNDYWTGDVKGLYTMTSAVIRGGAGDSTIDPSIKLIELSAASADADGTMVLAGGENARLSSFAVSAAKAGYWYAALRSDLTSGKEYRQDTGGEPPMGKCHNLSMFGFVAFPDSASAGKYVFLVNQNNAIYRGVRQIRSRKSPLVTPPGLESVPQGCLDWPTEATLKSDWTKLD